MNVRERVGRADPGLRRAHSFIEYRNFICAHMKRNDPISHRFLQRISMRTDSVLVYVRDAKTGRIF